MLAKNGTRMLSLQCVHTVYQPITANRHSESLIFVLFKIDTSEMLDKINIEVCLEKNGFPVGSIHLNVLQ